MLNNNNYPSKITIDVIIKEMKKKRKGDDGIFSSVVVGLIAI